jgi:hypothetical protein
MPLSLTSRFLVTINQFSFFLPPTTLVNLRACFLIHQEGHIISLIQFNKDPLESDLQLE